MLLNSLSRSQVLSRVVQGTCRRVTSRLQFMYVINLTTVTYVTVGDAGTINICYNTMCTYRLPHVILTREMSDCVFLQLASRVLKYVKCYPILYITQILRAAPVNSVLCLST